MNLVIVYSGQGRDCIYAATQANAISILNTLINENGIPKEIMKLVHNTEFHPVFDKLLMQSLIEVADVPVGEHLPKLRQLLYGTAKDGEDTRPEVKNTVEYTQEIALWLMKNKLNVHYFYHFIQNDSQINKLVDEISFLKSFKDSISKPILWTSATYVESANEIKTILNNEWIDGTTEEEIVTYILRVITKFTNRYNRFSLEEVRETFS